MGVLLGGLGRFSAALLALADAGRFSAPFTQVVQLGAADLAAAHHLDRIDRWRIERKNPLDAFPIGNLAHREVLVEPAARPADAHAFIGLHTRAVPFDHLHVHQYGIAGPEIRDFLAGGKLSHLLFFELLNYVHRVSPSATPPRRFGAVGKSREGQDCSFPGRPYTTKSRPCHLFGEPFLLDCRWAW